MVMIEAAQVAIAHHIEGVAYNLGDPIKRSKGRIEGVFAVSNMVRLIVVPEFNPEICYVLDIDREEWAKLKEAL